MLASWLKGRWGHGGGAGGELSLGFPPGQGSLQIICDPYADVAPERGRGPGNFPPFPLPLCFS